MIWGLIFSLSNLGWAPRKNLNLPVAWEEFASSVEELTRRGQARDDPGRLPVVGMDKYFIASQYAFYGGAGAASVSSQHLFGSPGRMWRWWSPAQQWMGSDLLLVALTRDELTRQKVDGYFEHLGPIRSRMVSKNGRPAARYFYRIGHGYKGVDPVNASAAVTHDKSAAGPEQRPRTLGGRP